jgi:hypothetical protein
LEALWLQATGLSNQDLEVFAGNEHLHELDIAATRVTEEVIELLITLPNLQRLSIYDTNLGWEALEKLRRAKPHLDITSG